MKSIDLSDGDSGPWTFDPERLLRCLTNLRNKVIFDYHELVVYVHSMLYDQNMFPFYKITKNELLSCWRLLWIAAHFGLHSSCSNFIYLLIVNDGCIVF